MTIKTWQERVGDRGVGNSQVNAMQSEIDDLRAALATRRNDTLERAAKHFAAMPADAVYPAQHVAKCIRALIPQDGKGGV